MRPVIRALTVGILAASTLTNKDHSGRLVETRVVTSLEELAQVAATEPITLGVLGNSSTCARRARGDTCYGADFHRETAHWTRSEALLYDFDSGVDGVSGPMEAVEFFKRLGIAAVLYPSKSDGIAKDGVTARRFHAIIPLETPIRRVDGRRPDPHHRQAVSTLASALMEAGFKPDASCVDAVRWFAPSLDGAARWVVDGRLYAAEMFDPSRVDARESVNDIGRSASLPDARECFEAHARFHYGTERTRIAAGDRHNKYFHGARMAIDAGMSFHEACDALAWFDEHCTKLPKRDRADTDRVITWVYNDSREGAFGSMLADYRAAARGLFTGAVLLDCVASAAQA